MFALTNEPAVDVTDAEALERFLAHVQCRLGSQVCDLRLALRPGGLVLQGRARTYYAKQLAQHAVMAVSPLPVVANEIEVAAAPERRG